jgi:hypothetical protein
MQDCRRALVQDAGPSTSAGSVVETVVESLIRIISPAFRTAFDGHESACIVASKSRVKVEFDDGILYVPGTAMLSTGVKCETRTNNYSFEKLVFLIRGITNSNF